MDEPESRIDLKQTFCFDFLSEAESIDAMSHSNQSNRTDIMKKYFVYMELPKIRIGDYRKSSCVSGNVIRFHFLLRIARDEENMVLRLLPIKSYKAPVVNFAVIHRPFLDDDTAKGPIPKSPGVRSPLISYDSEDARPGVPDSRTDDAIEDFRSDKAQTSSVKENEPAKSHQRRPSQTSLDNAPQEPVKSHQASLDKAQQGPATSPQRRPSQTSLDKANQGPAMSPKRRPSQTSLDKANQGPATSPQRRPSQTSLDKANQGPATSPQRRSSQTGIDTEQRFEVETPLRRPSQTSLDATQQAGTSQLLSSQTSVSKPPKPAETQIRESQTTRDMPQQLKSPQKRPSQTNVDKSPKQDSNPQPRLEMESPTHHQDDVISPAHILSDDNTTAHTDATGRQKHRRPKKYFVYCEIPKILVGDYRNSSVICSEIIHAHFLMKIARDEENGQPRLRPIKRYHRPRVNFAVIHRSLLVDDEAIGPIPRSPNVRSPMIREDEPEVDDDDVMHATMGFCYGRLPRSKYELVTQWSLVTGDGGGPPLPELVLSKADV